MPGLCGPIQGGLFSHEVDSPFCQSRTNIAVCQSKSLEDREIGKQFAPLWEILAAKLKVLFPEGDGTGAFIVPALDVHSQVLSIKDRRNGVGTPVFKLVPFGNGQVHLICVFLVFLMECCNRSSLKTARPMCDGRPFASPPFRCLAGRGPFFRGFPFRWALQFAFSLARCLTLQDATPCSREDLLYECGRPCDTPSCLFSTALWLRQSQSILTQGVQQTKDIDLTCYKTLPTKSVTCLQVGPMSLEWPVAPPAGSDQSSLSSSHEDLHDEHPEDVFQAGCSSTTSNSTR